MARTIEVGTLVGAGRWPMDHAHPDCWSAPWAGVVLARNDPRAWRGKIAFPDGRTPTQEQVDAMLAHTSGRDTSDTVPVLWDFGTHGHVSYFERTETLRPYHQDLAEWRTARDAAYVRYARPEPITLRLVG